MDWAKLLVSWSIRKRLLFLLLIIFLAALGIIISVGIRQRAEDIKTAQGRAMLVVQGMAAQQEQMALATRTMLTMLAQFPEVQRADAEASRRLFERLNEQYPFYTVILAVDPRGRVIAASKNFDRTTDLSDRKHVKDAIRTLDFAVGEYIVGRVSNTISINYTYPVLNAKRQLIAVLIAGFDLNQFSRFLSDASLPEGSSVNMLDWNGVRLFRVPDDPHAPAGSRIQAFNRIAGQSGAGFFDGKSMDGVERVFAFRPIRLRENDSAYLYLLAGLPKVLVVRPANVRMLWGLFVLGVAAALATGFSWFFGDYLLVRPINRLVVSAQILGKGNLTARTGLPHSDDELGRLARAFDEMTALLQVRNAERNEAEEALRKSEAEANTKANELAVLLDAVPVLTFIAHDAEGQKVTGSRAAYELLGVPPGANLSPYFSGKMQDRHFRIVCGRAELRYADSATRRAAATGQPLRGVEETILFEDGTSRDLLGDTVPLLNESGQVRGAIGAFIDVTERNRALEQLHQSEARLRRLVDSDIMGVIFVAADGRIEEANATFLKMLGYTPEDLSRGLNCRTLTGPDDPCLGNELHGQSDTGSFGPTERTFIARDGSRLPVLVGGAIDDRESRRMIAMALDLTELKKSQAKAAQLAAIVEGSADAILGITLDGAITSSNDAARRLYGYTTDEIIGQTFSALFSSAQAWKAPSGLEAITAGELLRPFESMLLRKDGSTFDAQVSLSPIFGTDGKIVGTASIAQDITGRKSTEKALLRSEERFTLAVHATKDLLWDWDVKAGSVWRSASYWEHFGYPPPDEEPGPKEFVDRLHRDDRARARTIFRDTRVKQLSSTGEIECRFRRSDGTYANCVNRASLVYDESGKLIRAVGAVRDVSESWRMMEQLRQAQKLEATGQLAAGIAHEINTPIQFVGDNAQFVKEVWGGLHDILRTARAIREQAGTGVPDKELLSRFDREIEVADLDYTLEEVPRAIDHSLEGIRRVARIVHAMKEFSHRGLEEKSPTDINRAITATVTVARNEWKYVADVQLSLDPELPLVPCFAAEFNQVILNLLVNAAHAIEEKVGRDVTKGVIKITTRREGDWIEAIVRDNGSGIPETVMNRIFEPFFTTKPIGKGTGQGLAMAHSAIVARHGGKLWCESELGAGTAFFIRLPLSA